VIVEEVGEQPPCALFLGSFGGIGRHVRGQPFYKGLYALLPLAEGFAGVAAIERWPLDVRTLVHGVPTEAFQPIAQPQGRYAIVAVVGLDDPL
jgi:hypothetical protein